MTYLPSMYKSQNHKEKTKQNGKYLILRGGHSGSKLFISQIPDVKL